MAVMIALTMPIFIGSIALAVDVAQWTLAKRILQRQADSGALAGVYALAQNADAQASVTRDLALNARYKFYTAPVIERGPSVGEYAGDTRAVRVVLRTALRLPFAAMFLPDGVRVSAEATAALIATSEACVLALVDSDTVGISMGGNTTVDLNCAMMTNSVAEEAINAFGSADVSATPIVAVGGLDPSSNYAEGTELIPYSLAQPDPYAGLPEPAIPGGNGRMEVKPNRKQTFNPGTYSKVDIKGQATLNPGVYYIDGGNFDVGAKGVVNAEGVTIVLTSRTAASNAQSVAGVDINGGATLNMVASKSGTYAGILFYQDRRAANETQKINGNAASKLQGALYFPSSTLEFTGDSDMRISCVQLVGWRLAFRGNSKIANVCPENEGAKAFSGYAVRLVS